MIINNKKVIRYTKIPIVKKLNKFLTKITIKNIAFNSFFSSIFRIFFRFEPIYSKVYFLRKNTKLKNIKEFWIIRIGFLRKKNYLPFINVDNYISNGLLNISNIRNLPFRKKSCQMIHIKYFFKYFHIKDFNKVIKTWKKKLIPGGMLKIHIDLKKNEKKVENLKNILEKNNFFIENIDESELEINGNLIITAISQEIIKSTPKHISIKKIKDIFLILKQNKSSFSNMNKICVLGYQSEKISKYLQKLNLDINQIQNFNSINLVSNISNNYFDGAIIANFFEYNNYSSEKEIFNEIRRILQPNANILAIVPEKTNYYTKDNAQLFDKGIFVKKLDDYNLAFKWINLNSSLKLIQVLIENKNNFPLENNRIKICLLGVYSLRYTFLSNARWDSQARAFKKLGYIVQIFDIEDNSFKNVFKQVKKINPDILWIGGKIGYDFLKKYADFFRGSKIKIVYWHWDIITPIKFDFNGIIDCMFITSKGEIPLYEKKYNLDKVYYVPVSIMPEIFHRNKFIKEIYDVGFAGQLNYSHPFYKERTAMLDFISQYYKVKIFKKIYNNLSEYYSQCKIVYGGTPYFKDLDLYASNRPYIALASGCCFITNYFRGLEKLAENEKHLLWYKTKEELKYLLEKYMSNDSLRNKIKRNAEKLAREKHNYISRIKNMLDIVNGKTEEFYGFIN